MHRRLGGIWSNGNSRRPAAPNRDDSERRHQAHPPQTDLFIRIDWPISKERRHGRLDPERTSRPSSCREAQRGPELLRDRSPAEDRSHTSLLQTRVHMFGRKMGCPICSGARRLRPSGCWSRAICLEAESHGAARDVIGLAYSALSITLSCLGVTLQTVGGRHARPNDQGRNRPTHLASSKPLPRWWFSPRGAC